MKGRLIAILSALLLMAGIAVASTTPARADTYSQICDDANFCLNAWNGGSLIKIYGNDVINDAFQINSLGSGYYDIESQTTGLYIGDYQNNQYDAKAGEDGYGAWGYRFTKDYSQCLSPAFALKNVHWGGYISGSDFNGSQVYLNSSPSCYEVTTFNA